MSDAPAATTASAPAPAPQPHNQPGHHPRQHPHHRVARVLAAVLLGLGVTAVVAIHGAVHNADSTVQQFYDRTAFADYVVQGGNSAQFANAASKVPGVATVRSRVTATLAVWLGGDKVKVQGTLIGVPDQSPGIDRLEVVAGRPLEPTANDAVVERHSADDLGIVTGDPLRLLGIGDVVDVNVRGVATSPEYLLPAASQQQIVTARGSFVVVFVPETLAQRIAGDSAVPQVLVRYRSNANTARVDAALARAARRAGAALTYTPKDQPSNAILSEERAGFDDAAVVLPGIFLLIGALVIALVAGQTTRVLGGAHDDGDGLSRRARLRAIAGPVAIGLLWGLLAGWLGARVLVGTITGDLALDDPIRRTPFGAAAIAIGAALLAALLAYAIAVLPVARKRVNSIGAGGVAAVALTSALALVAILAPMGVVDSARATLDRAASLERVDAQVSYEGPAGADQLTQLRAIRGVAVAEATPSADVVVENGTRRYATELEGFSPDTQVQSFDSPDGSPIALPRTGVLMPRPLARLIGAHVGDTIGISITGSGLPPMALPLSGLTSDTLGNLVFTRTSTLHAALGPNPGLAGGLFNTATLRFGAGADAASIASTVQQLPGVAVYVPVGADLGTVASARPIFSILVDVFVAVGALTVILAIAAIVAAATPATSNAMQPGRLIRAVLLGVAIGAVPGILLGRAAANSLVDALESDLVHLVRTTDGSSIAIALAVIASVASLTVVAIAQEARRRRRREASPTMDLRPYPAVGVPRTVRS